MDRVIQSVKQHIEAWNKQDNAIVAAGIAFPFVQIDHDGTMQIMTNAEDLFDFAALDDYSTSLADAEIVQSGPTMSVVKLAFNWEYPNRDFVGVGHAVWGLEEIDGEFKLRWRQFLGWDGA